MIDDNQNVMHRAQRSDPIPRLDAAADGEALRVVLDRGWLEARPLLAADLADEPGHFATLGLRLAIDTA